MKKENVLSIILIIYLTGCAVHLVPKGNPEIKISPSGLMVEQESRGIKVSVDGGMSKFTKFDKYTPIFLIIKNNTDKIISLEYGNFTIKDEANNIYKPFSIKEVIGSVEHNKPFQLAKWDGRFIGNNRKVLVNKNNGVFLVKENGWKVVKDDSKGKKRGYVFIYPFYDPFYNPFFDYPFYPYGPYSPYYGRMFYPYDYYYYYGYYNPYRHILLRITEKIIILICQWISSLTGKLADIYIFHRCLRQQRMKSGFQWI